MGILALSESDQLKRIHQKQAKILVVGLGKMGLPIVTAFTNAGYTVHGLDVVQEHVERLNRGETSINEPGVPERLKIAVEKGLFKAFTDVQQACENVDFVVVIIPVLIDDLGQADLKDLLEVYHKLAGYTVRGTIYIQESTLPPKTTSGILKETLEQEGKESGTDFGLVFAPERTYSGRALKDIEENYPKIVGGDTENAGYLAKLLYEQIAQKGVIQVKNATTAEAVKTFKGAYRDANIAIANQLAILADKIGVDIIEVIDAANTEPFSHIHRPGIGVGGHCIPVYPHFIINSGEGIKHSNTLFKEARITNDYMIEYAYEKISKYAPDWNRNVLILGLAYRGGVKELRLSPTLRLVPYLKANGVDRVKVLDPLYTQSEIEHIFGPDRSFPDKEFNQRLQESLEWASIVIIVTDHDEFKKVDYRLFSNKIVFDGRYILNENIVYDFFLIQPGREIYTR